MLLFQGGPFPIATEPQRLLKFVLECSFILYYPSSKDLTGLLGRRCEDFICAICHAKTYIGVTDEDSRVF